MDILSPQITLILAIGFMIASFILIFMVARKAIAEERQVKKRLTAGAPAPTESVDAKQSAKNFLSKLGKHLTLPDDEEITRLRYLLSQAGFFGKNAVPVYLGVRLVSVIVPQIVLLIGWAFFAGNYAWTTIVFAAAVMAAIGIYGPPFFLNQRKKKRSLLCKEGFPDMMDLLVACIEAGLALDAALIRVSNELTKRYPPLKTALDIMNLELRAGKNRNDAMQSFARRVDLEEARALAVMLKQAEEMGSSLGATLRTFSEDMRAKRMLRAEEKALALSAKLTVPLIVFIFPTIMVMLMLPAGIRLSGAF